MAKKRRQHDHDEHMDESWLIPYADILTLLLALFIVLFASSSVDAKKFQEIMVSFNSVLSGGEGVFETGTVVPIGVDAGEKGRNDNNEGNPEKNRNELTEEQKELQEKIQEETLQLENLKQKIDAYIEENGLNSQLTTELNNFQLVLRISDNALFAPGSAQVKEDSKKLAIAISKMLETYPQYQIVVSGHTDDVPIRNAQFQDNWDLSAGRALNFMRILMSNEKLDPARFSSKVHGEYSPIDTNDTSEGRGANRRVEVSIIRNIVEAPAQFLTPSQ